MSLFIISIVSVAFIMPSAVFAAVNAGAVSGIWFSTSTFVEQTQVNIFAAVQNETSETLTGTVEFFVDGNAVGTTSFFALSAKVMRIALPYTFTPGVHSVSGRVSSMNKNISMSYGELPARSITVAELPPPPPPPPPPSSQAVNNSGGGGGGGGAFDGVVTSVSQKGNGVIASVNPVAEVIARSLESVRDTLVQRQGNTATVTKGKTGAIAKKSTNNLFDVSIELTGLKDVPLWRRVLAIFLGISAWLVRYWLWVIGLILVTFVWRMVHRRRKY